MDVFVQHKKGDVPVAIIQNGTTGKDKMVTGTVRDIVYRAEHAGICNPAVIVVGEVVRLQPAFVKKVITSEEFCQTARVPS